MNLNPSPVSSLSIKFLVRVVLLFFYIQEEELREGRFHFSGYGIATCMKDGVAVKSDGGVQQTSVENNKRKFVDRAKRIDTISRAAFPLAFLIFNIFYWITYKIIRHDNTGKV